VQAWAGSVWADVRDRLVDAARRPDSQLRARLGEALASAGARLAEDRHLQETVDAWFVDAVTTVTTQHGERVADYIAATVERWDPEDTATRLELVVGRDLQFIRINGTVVGGLAGLLIYFIGNLL
jgi:uncharacterized membrane-anchored protein YjiN (DUF445 family)